MKVDTKKLDEQIAHSTKTSLSEVLKDLSDVDFRSKLEEVLLEKNMKKSDVIQLTSLDRNYAYQIFNGTKMPGKDKVIQLCLAMSCDLEMTNRLLVLSNNPTLYSKIKRDAVIMFAIQNSYSVMLTNEMLVESEFDIL